MPMAFQDQILNIALSQNWVALGVNLILSTLIGGIVVVILLAIAGRAFGEPVKLPNAFIMVLVINIVNFTILAFLSRSIPATLGLFIPVLIWVGFTKGFFSGLAWWHAVVVGIVGYVLSIFIIPNLVAFAAGFVPTFGL